MKDSYNCSSPYANYQGKFTRSNLIFNANLQVFSERVSHICQLETAGNLSPQDAFKILESLWEQLKENKPSLSNS
ncbi:MAG: hypothetical protein VKL42_12065 [Snowella sp.]|nr:hypothetical protein [Snowella sp.]